MTLCSNDRDDDCAIRQIEEMHLNDLDWFGSLVEEDHIEATLTAADDNM